MTNQSPLSIVPSEVYEQRWERFNISHEGCIMAVLPALAGLTLRPCKMVDISQGTASFTVNTTIGLPQHFYLTFAGTERRIGCAEAYRHEHRVGVKFIKPIDADFLRQIVAFQFELPSAKRKSTMPSLYRAPLGGQTATGSLR
ncbi:PilZ domain-containing protein [Pararhizobium sp.]|uniref:PilZ domain-containing protein n=1 Tax=Pararhizobium sp. TaxID=1977563 RepID=UPI00271C3F2C|nr:PilZ domain-containing protein [Pararhizobium sp.]MDO9418544.1 PilZ domain-containing protein [Pararhizobium sp.]